jgi:hypothetical protein
MLEYDYTPPKPADLIKLQKDLGYTGSQMAKLFGLSGANEWQKYTREVKPLKPKFSMLFMVATRLTLSAPQLLEVTEEMRKMGAMLVHRDPQPKK